MRAAIQLGRRHMGLTGPNPSVGAIIVKEGVVVGRGVTARGGRPHAEVQALSEAAEKARGATMYVTLEPCSHHGKTPPCVDAIIAAGISRVVVAVDDPDPRVNGNGYEVLKKAGVRVEKGVAELEARADLVGHLLKHEKQRPFTTLKLAISKDGFLSGKGCLPVQITCEKASRYVHLMRAQHSAILVGINTVLSDNPKLTCRLEGLEDRSPTRIVLDPSLRIPTESALVTPAVQTPVYVLTPAAETDKAKLLKAQYSVEVLALDNFLPNLLRAAGSRLLVEGGAETASRFLNAGLVDEVVLFTHPKLELSEGTQAYPHSKFPSFDAFAESFELKLSSEQQIGTTQMRCFKPIPQG